MNFSARLVLTSLAAAVPSFCTAAEAPPVERTHSIQELRIIHGEQDDAIAVSLKPQFEQGQKRVEQFFRKPFRSRFDIEVVPDRAAFDDYFRKRWKIPKTEDWMVASGVADRLVILSPRVWKTQAVEHDPANVEHVRDIIAHELVHVYHGQHNPHPDFDGMDDLGWFVEGLAVYVSGQLERSPHRGGAREALSAGKAPAKLADAWSGRYRYGVAGSMAEFVDVRYGRAALEKLMPVVTNEEALKALNTTESKFLETWKAYLSDQPPPKS
jgi:hypothetical protein